MYTTMYGLFAFLIFPQKQSGLFLEYIHSSQKNATDAYGIAGFEGLTSFYGFMYRG